MSFHNMLSTKKPTLSVCITNMVRNVVDIFDENIKHAATNAKASGQPS